jgi:transposase
MDRLYDRVCGLDVHKKTITACVRLPGVAGARRQLVEVFGTMAADLLAVRDWLHAHEVTHVAMESSGVYWKPVYYVLEEQVTCLLVNAQQVSKVPGRKTDTMDAAWLAQLLEHGLLRASFVPPPPQRELRDLTRYRKSVLQERTREANRLHKLLEDAGIKLASIASDILGASGRAMLEALVHGTTDPAVLADLAKGTLRRKLPALQQALAGRFRRHHAFLVSQLLAHLDYLDEAIERLTAELEERLRPFAAELARLDTIPGVARRTAEVLLAEVGPDMARFPSPHHLASWAALCPGNHESAGKRTSGRARKGNRWLRTALIEAANAAAHTRNTALAARYHRLVRHRGHKKAVVAVAHQILVLAWHLLHDQTDYIEFGAAHVDAREAAHTRRRALRTLERQGYRVTLQPTA